MPSCSSYVRVVRPLIHLCLMILLPIVWLWYTAHLTTAAPAAPTEQVYLQGAITQDAKVAASDGTTESYFGYVVAISGNTFVVGAPGATIGTKSAQGAAYVFEYDSDTATWSQVKKLTASDGAAGDVFGSAVQIEGDTIVVGAGQADIDGGAFWEINQGAAYVFERNEGGPDNWGEVKKLTASDAGGGDTFGIWGLALSGDLLVVGADFATVDYGSQGAAYVFERNEGGLDNWGEVKKLTASDGAADDRFGTGIAIDDDAVFVGTLNANKVYMFERNEGGTDNWGEKTTLTGSDSVPGKQFGWMIATSGDTMVIAEPYAQVGDTLNQGAAYVFERDSDTNTWNEVKKLTASDGAELDLFGSYVAIHGDIIIASPYLTNAQYDADQGKVYVFERNEGGTDAWGEVEILTASDGTPNDVFAAAALNSDTLVIGANMAHVGGTSDQGAAYVFSLADDTTPTVTTTPDDTSTSEPTTTPEETPVTTTPEETSTPAATTTATTTPQETSTATPDETTTPEPDETTTPEPDETTPVTTTPAETATPVPGETTTVTTTPEETVTMTVTPEETATPDPQETPAVDPNESGNATLTITITCSSEVKPGSEVVCTITYENSGSVAASNVQLTMTLPGGALFNADLSTPGWNATTAMRSDATQYLFAVGDLAAGAQGTVQAGMTISPEVRAGSTVEIDAGIVSENVESSSGQSSHHATIVVNAYNVYMPMIGGTR